jgi:hypothetical protein
MNMPHWAFACCVLALTGCTSTTTGQKIETDKLAQIQKGKTTESEVVSLLGPPMSTMEIPGGKKVLNYSYTHAAGHATGTSFVPYVNFFAGRAKGSSEFQHVSLTVGTNGVVEDVRVSQGATQTQTTGGIFGTSTTTTPVAPPK